MGWGEKIVSLFLELRDNSLRIKTFILYLLVAFVFGASSTNCFWAPLAQTINLCFLSLALSLFSYVDLDFCVGVPQFFLLFPGSTGLFCGLGSGPNTFFRPTHINCRLLLRWSRNLFVSKISLFGTYWSFQDLARLFLSLGLS